MADEQNEKQESLSDLTTLLHTVPTISSATQEVMRGENISSVANHGIFAATEPHLLESHAILCYPILSHDHPPVQESASRQAGRQGGVLMFSLPHLRVNVVPRFKPWQRYFPAMHASVSRSGEFCDHRTEPRPRKKKKRLGGYHASSNRDKTAKFRLAG